MTDQKILDAFQTMWGPFPEPVLLVHKDRTILASNGVAGSAGCVAGIKCYSNNPEAVTTTCRGCKANLALREHRTISTEAVQNGNRIISYWMPLDEVPDVYVHFGVGCAAAMGIEPDPVVRDAEAGLVNVTS